MQPKYHNRSIAVVDYLRQNLSCHLASIYSVNKWSVPKFRMSSISLGCSISILSVCMSKQEYPFTPHQYELTFLSPYSLRHSSSESPDYFDWILRTYEMYDQKLPYFHGEIPENLKKYFSTHPNVPVHVKASNLKDEHMKHFLDFNPENKEFKNEDIHIYLNQ